MRNRILELLHVMPVSVVVIRDDTGRIADVNHAFVSLFGISRADCLGKAVESLPIWEDAGFWAARGDQLRRTTDRTDHFEAHMRNAQGHALVCELAALRHDTGTPHMTILAVDDVTLRREAERRLRHLAHNDPLTGLPNRASLQRLLVEATVRRRQDGTSFAVAMLDLDGFKAINDLHGHDAGDAVLVEVAKRLETVSRASDLVCRLGGDEFVLLLFSCGDDESARAIAQRTLEAVGKPLPMADGSYTRVGASIGIAHGISTDEADPVAPLRRADQAMYQAKADGKNQVALYDRRNVTRAPLRDFLLGPEGASAAPLASS
jgi:diguanylate cyclase (GGDEF)-like protein/PAS domain S-box-containing protein